MAQLEGVRYSISKPYLPVLRNNYLQMLKV